MKLRHAALVIGSTVLALGCQDVKGNEEPVVRPVKVMETRTAAPTSGVRYAAMIQPEMEVPLAFKVAGYISNIPQRPGADGRMRALQAGDAVQAGAVLALVGNAEYRERVSQLTGSLREVEASGLRAGLDWARAQALFAADSLTKPDLDAAMAASDAAAARIAAVGAQVELAEIALRDCALASPIDGIVFTRHVEVGSLVNAGSIGFVVGKVSSVKAVFGVPDTVVNRIALGTPLNVMSEALGPEPFTGTVTSVSPSADRQAHIFNVEVTIPNKDGRLKPGMIGAVEIHHDSPVGALPAIPLTAIVRSPMGQDGYAVFVVERSGDRDYAHSRAVKLGTVQGNMMTVTDGLRAGERVIVMGANVVTDREHVRVIQ